MPTPTMLRRIRKDQARTLQSLAREVGCSHATIINYETGATQEGRPSIRAKIEAALGVPISVLLMPDPQSTAGRPESRPAGVAATRNAASPESEDGASDGS